MRESLEMLQFIALSLTGLAAIEARVNFTDAYCSDFNKTPPPESEQPGRTRFSPVVPKTRF